MSAAGKQITGIVAMVRVADVERSIAFYTQFGLQMGNREPREGRMHWAWLYSPAAADWRRGPNLMLTRNERPTDPNAQGVLFYLYVDDLPSLRAALISAGQKVGEIEYPPYLPKGEFQMTDPDGYCLMVAQAAADTP